MEQHEIELEVTKLMQELQSIEKDKNIATLPYAIIIEENVAKQKEIEMPYDEKYVAISNKIRELILMREKSLKTGAGSVTYRKGSTRRTWDLDALDITCDKYEDIKSRIWHYRKESIGDPSVTIKIDTAGISVSNI